jgi:hypothetical protein
MVKGSSISTGSTSCASGSTGLLSAGARRSISNCAAWTSPSCTRRRSRGASCQPMRASRTSTARLSLSQRSQPMRPPARSDPLTSRLSSVCPAGR